MSRIENIIDNRTTKKPEIRSFTVPDGFSRMQITIEQHLFEKETTRKDTIEAALTSPDGVKLGRCVWLGGSADSLIRPGIRRLWCTASWGVPKDTNQVTLKVTTSKPIYLRAHMDFF